MSIRYYLFHLIAYQMTLDLVKSDIPTYFNAIEKLVDLFHYLPCEGN